MENINNNLYLIESDNYIVINNQIKKILNDNNLDEEYLVTYDMENHLIDDVINDLDTYSLFDNIKVIHASNCNFLTADKDNLEHNIELFTKYINNPSKNILIVSCRKMDSKKKICKLIKEHFVIMNTTISYPDYIKDKINGYEFSQDNINYFISLVGEDLDRIDNELNKLLMYKYDSKIISKNDIDDIVIKKSDDNIFDLIEMIIKKDKKRSLEIYQEMKNNGEEDFKIVISLANQIRLLYQVKVLENESDLDIANQLGLKNPKQLYFLRKKIANYSEKELVDYLHKLCIIDEELKTGKKEEMIILPIFIASI